MHAHSVYNNTTKPRIILFIDIERPLIFAINYLNNTLVKYTPFSNFVQNVNDVEEKIYVKKEYFMV